MREYSIIIGIVGCLFCIGMSMHVGSDWGFNGVAGIFAILAFAFATMTASLIEE